MSTWRHHIYEPTKLLCFALKHRLVNVWQMCRIISMKPCFSHNLFILKENSVFGKGADGHCRVAKFQPHFLSWKTNLMFKICIADGWDLAEWLERLAANANFATVLGSSPASSDTVQSEGRQMKQCWITYIKKIKSQKSPFLMYCWAQFCLFNKNILPGWRTGRYCQKSPRPSLMTAFRLIPLSTRAISLDNTFNLEEQWSCDGCGGKRAAPRLRDIDSQKKGARRLRARCASKTL